MPLQTVKWLISNEEYIVRNVPYMVIDEEEFFSTNVCIVIATLRDLMVENKIPKEVDYTKFKDIKF